jgi:hypothetical protein
MHKKIRSGKIKRSDARRSLACLFAEFQPMTMLQFCQIEGVEEVTDAIIIQDENKEIQKKLISKNGVKKNTNPKKQQHKKTENKNSRMIH